MIPRDRLDAVREKLRSLLSEDAHNTQRLLERLEALALETGLDVHAAALLILTRLSFREDEARRHWEAIVARRERLSEALGREVGLRVALMDYFLNENRNLLRPTLIDVEMLEATEREATGDPLTGLLVDRAFRHAVQQELRRARRYDQAVAVVLFDLDGFAEVNREHGGDLADRFLRESAILLKNKIRDIDLAGRPGEDELSLLLPETDGNGALLVAERFRGEFEAYFARREAGGEPVRLTLSAGVAAFPVDGRSAHELLERAAQALYTAKASGRNTVQRFQPERRRYLRLEFAPGRFEIEVLAREGPASGSLRDLSRSGLLFSSPEPIDVGERIEIRLADGPGLRVRGRIVRLEALPLPLALEASDEAAASADRFELGMAFESGSVDETDDLVRFLEWVQARPAGARS